MTPEPGVADRRGRHRHDDGGEGRRRVTRRGKTIAGVFAALTTAGAVLAGTALAAGPAVPPPSDPEDSPAARAAHAAPVVPGTPCTTDTRGCVDLEKQIAWLIRDGKVVRGPMKISSGGENQATPVGHSLRVYRKEADHKSGESKTKEGLPAPMPWSVFFQDGGIAFHAGDPARSSAGCIRMEDADAKAMFDDLQIGDKVQTVNGSAEYKARHPGGKP